MSIQNKAQLLDLNHKIMDDKLKNFLDDNEEEKKNDDNTPKEEKKEENKYDKFFNDAEEWGDKAKDVLEKTSQFVGDKLKDAGEFVGDSLKETGRFFKEGSKEAGKIIKEDIIPKAKEAKEKLDKNVDDLTEKLKDYSDAPIKKTKGSDLDDSLFDTHDDFFSKMEKIADNLDKKDKEKTNNKKIGDLEITGKIENKDPKLLDDGRKLLGFDDLDGDGDELIDDAIIDDE